MKIIAGRVLSFKKNPFYNLLNDSYHLIDEGGVLINNNIIEDIGEINYLKKKYSKAEVFDYGKSLISSGFIDSHMHYPQTGIIASWGKRLIDWLNEYTFPEEIKFKDSLYARNIASKTLDYLIKNGTTTASSFCTTHPQSVEVFFDEANKREMLVLGGKNCMDRNAPTDLLDTPKKSFDESENLIKKWHNKNRIKYAITPRFAPTSSPDQLEALGHLWKKYPDCLMQTHLSEQKEEIEWVKKLFPQSQSYLDVYEKFSLIGNGAIYGHSIHLSQDDINKISDTNSSVIHCPTSNLFIGSGLFKMRELNESLVKIGLGTDTGGGTSFSMLKTMSEAYKVSQLNKNVIHPIQLHWLATQGSAIALNIDDKVGNLKIGNYADIVAINLTSTGEIKQRYIKSSSFFEQYFPTIIMGDDRAIEAVWINGKLIHSKQML